MAHQRLIADVAGELDPATGAPRYRDVIVLMPRRGGKTVLVLAQLLERMRRRPTVRTFYTSQTAHDAEKVVRDEWQPLITQSPWNELIAFRLAKGDTGMAVELGRRRLSRCAVFTPGPTSLHGRDSDLTVVDEIWAHDLERGQEIDAGIRPARWARPGGQIWYVSAGGTEESSWLHSKMGLAGTTGVAYFEWSADHDAPGYDPYDETLWWATHPALGQTVGIEALRADAATMTRSEFERALLCVWPRSAGSALLAGWEELLDPAAAPADPLWLAVDVTPDRDHAAIAMSGGGATEIIEHRPGVDWLAGRLDELLEAHDVIGVARDPSGPAGATDLAGLATVDVNAPQLAEACAALVDAIRAKSQRLRPHPGLATAFASAQVLKRGDGRFVWGRRTSGADLSPLYAANLALWAALEHRPGAIY